MLNDGPVYLACFVNHGFAGQRLGVDFADAGIVGAENRGGAVGGFYRYLFNRRIVNGIGQEEVCVILGYLGKRVLGVLILVAHQDVVFLAADQLAFPGGDGAAERTILKIIRSGGGHSLFIDRPVKGAGFCCRHVKGNIGVLNRAGLGIAGGKIGLAVVRRGKIHALDRAAVVARVHQHSRKDIGGAGLQAGNFLRKNIVGVLDGQIAAFYNFSSVGGRLNQIVGVERAVSAQADSPVQLAGLVRHKGGLGLVGGNIRQTGIAAQDARLV